MKKIISILIIVFISANTFAQTNMIIRKSDQSTITVPISKIDSVYYENKVTDYDGNTYNTVQIGTQVWMAENLKVTHYPHGDAIPLVIDNTAWKNLESNSTADAYCFYNNNNTTNYGALYTYAAAIGDKWTRDLKENQGVCPDGWHLPTNTDWDVLNTYLGTNAGSKLAGNAALWKGTSSSLEQSADFGTSGFSALPSGYRYYLYGKFTSLGTFTHWWSATQLDYSKAYNRYLNYNNTDINSYNKGKSSGYSVRCIRD